MTLPVSSIEIAFTSDAVEDPPTWEDVTARVLWGEAPVTVRWGRSAELEDFQAGVFGMVADNSDRALDPTYASSPYYPDVTPRRQLRWRVDFAGDTFAMFRGNVDGFQQEYHPPAEAVAVVPAVDFFKLLADWGLPGASAWEMQIDANGPAAWYRLDDPVNASIVADATGAWDGQYLLSPQQEQAGLVPYENGKSVLFPGTESSDDVRGAARLGYSVSGSEWSIELWAQHGLWTGLFFGYVFSQDFFGNGTTTRHGVALLINGTGGSFDGRAGVTLTGLAGGALASLARVDDGVPHHFVIVRDGTDVYFYVDGVLNDSGTTTAGPTTPGPMYLGCRELNTNLTWASNATIDEVVMYDRALTAGEAEANHDAGRTAWAGEHSGERLERLLDFAGWPASLRDIDTGISIVQAHPAGATTLLDAGQLLNRTEQGAFFMARTGKITFRDRYTRLGVTPLAIFGDGGGSELEYSELIFDYSDSEIRNEARLTAPGLPEQSHSDPASILTYGRRTYSRDTLDASIAALLGGAQSVVDRYKDPLLRVTTMKVRPQFDTDAMTVCLALDVGSLITVNRRPQSLGPTITQDAFVEGVAHSVQNSQWETTVFLSTADTRGYWILDTSELDVDTRLGF